MDAVGPGGDANASEYVSELRHSENPFRNLPRYLLRDLLKDLLKDRLRDLLKDLLKDQVRDLHKDHLRGPLPDLRRDLIREERTLRQVEQIPLQQDVSKIGSTDVNNDQTVMCVCAIGFSFSR